MMDLPGAIDDVNELRLKQTLSKFNHDSSSDVEARICSILLFPSPKFQEFVDVVHGACTDLAVFMREQIKLWIEDLVKQSDLRSKPGKTSAALILLRALGDVGALDALCKLLEVLGGPSAYGDAEVKPVDWVIVNLTDRAHLLQKLPHEYVGEYVAFAEMTCEKNAADFKRKAARLFLMEVVKAGLPELSDKILSWLKMRWQSAVKTRRHDNGSRSIYQLLTDLSMKNLITSANGSLDTEEVVRYLLEMDIYSSSDWAKAFSILEPNRKSAIVRQLVEEAVSALQPQQLSLEYSLERDELAARQTQCKPRSHFDSYKWQSRTPASQTEAALPRLLENLNLKQSRNLKKLTGVLIHLANDEKDEDARELLLHVLAATGWDTATSTATAQDLTDTVRREITRRGLDVPTEGGMLDPRHCIWPQQQQQPLSCDETILSCIHGNTTIQAMILEQAFRDYDFQSLDVDFLGRVYEAIMSSKAVDSGLCKKTVAVVLEVLEALDKKGVCVEFAVRRLVLTAVHKMVAGPRGLEELEDFPDQQQDEMVRHAGLWCECLTDMAQALLKPGRGCVCGDELLHHCITWCLTSCPPPDLDLLYDMVAQLLASKVDVRDFSSKLIANTLQKELAQRGVEPEADRSPFLRMLLAKVRKEKGFWKHGPVLDFMLTLLKHNTREEHLLALDLCEEVVNDILAQEPGSVSLPADQFRLSLLVYSQCSTVLAKSAQDVDEFVQQRARSLLHGVKVKLAVPDARAGAPDGLMDSLLAAYMDLLDHHNRLALSPLKERLGQAEEEKYEYYSLPLYTDTPEEVIRAMESSDDPISMMPHGCGGFFAAEVDAADGSSGSDMLPKLTLTVHQVASLQSLLVQILEAAQPYSASQAGANDDLVELLEELWLQVWCKDVQPCMDCE